MPKPLDHYARAEIQSDMQRVDAIFASGIFEHRRAKDPLLQVMFGAGCMAEINGVRIESMYSDDIAFFFGPQRLYLRRHIARAYKDAVAHLRPLLEVR